MVLSQFLTTPQLNFHQTKTYVVTCAMANADGNNVIVLDGVLILLYLKCCKKL